MMASTNAPSPSKPLDGPSPDGQAADRIRLKKHRVAVKSLRRRFRKALREENASTALRAYTATMEEYDRWIEEERTEKQLQQKMAQLELDEKEKRRRDAPVDKDGTDPKRDALLQHKSSLALSKKMGSFLRSTRASLRALDDMTHAAHQQRRMTSGTNNSSENVAGSSEGGTNSGSDAGEGRGGAAAPPPGGRRGSGRRRTSSFRRATAAPPVAAAAPPPRDIPPPARRSNSGGNLLCPCPPRESSRVSSDSSGEAEYTDTLPSVHESEDEYRLGEGEGEEGGVLDDDEDLSSVGDGSPQPRRERMVSVDLADAPETEDDDHGREREFKEEALAVAPEGREPGLLEMEMHPSAPFVAGDDFSPDAVDDDDSGEEGEGEAGDSDAGVSQPTKDEVGKKKWASWKNKRESASSTTSTAPRLAGFFAWGGGGGNNHDRDDDRASRPPRGHRRRRRRRGSDDSGSAGGGGGGGDPLSASLSSSLEDGISDRDADDEEAKADGDGDDDEEGVDMTTPLHQAARIGNGELVRLLLLHGGDPNVRDGRKRTALHMAAGGLTDAEEGLLLSAVIHAAEAEGAARSVKEEKEEEKGVEHASQGAGVMDVDPWAAAVAERSTVAAPPPEPTRQPARSTSTGEPILSPYEMYGPNIGIRSSNHPDPDSKDGADSADDESTGPSSGAKKVGAAMGRFFKQAMAAVKASDKSGSESDEKSSQKGWEPGSRRSSTRPVLPLDPSELNRRTTDRMDSTLALLTWSGSNGSSSSQGPSINSVDVRGRTALHYASEVGRTDVCMALLSAFGILLTLIDESGCTPCELAGNEGHSDLASQLEARALLFSDPYGMDDELMASVLIDNDGPDEIDPDEVDAEEAAGAGNDENRILQAARRKRRKKLVPPFSWFETWTMEDVDAERQRRVKTGLSTMRDILKKRKEEEAMKELMFSHGDALEREVGPDEDENEKEGAVAAAGAGEKTEEDTENESKPPAAEDDTPGAIKEGRNGEMDDDVDLEGSATANEGDTVAEGEATVPDSQESAGAPAASSPGDGADVALEPVPKTDEATRKSEDQKDAEATEGDGKAGLEGSDPPGDDEPDAEDTVAAKKDGAASVDEEGAGEESGADCDRPKQKADALDLASCLNESHAAQLLSFHHWKKGALNAFEQDPEKALSDANLVVEKEVPPSTLESNNKKPDDIPKVDNDGAENGPAGQEEEQSATEKEVEMCLICCEEYETNSPEWKQMEGCEHSFCTPCLGDYITEAAQSRSSGLILTCPHHECGALLSQGEIKSLSPSGETYESLVQTANENFVSGAYDLKFCPHPGCGGVVKRVLPRHLVMANFEDECIDCTGAVCTMVSDYDDASHVPTTYEGVQDPAYTDIATLKQPLRAHRFCFSCGDEVVHWPATCDVMEKWREKISEEIGDDDANQRGEEGKEGGEKLEDLAHRLWIKANTRPCPKCKAPIEKNDGCNHMTCTNRHCRHEFCWICRKDWKLHNTKTGGFFRCNRWQEEEDHDFYDTPPPPQQHVPGPDADAANPSNVEDQNYGTALHSARVARKKARAMARFVHHYSRWTAHGDSSALERKMSERVSVRLASVVKAAKEFNGDEHFDFGGKGLSFVHAAFTELLECRSFLRHSYAFAFFRYPKSSPSHYRIRTVKEREKMAFEQLQSELEMLTEQMSDIVARSHLRATQTQIMFLTRAASDKRRELSNLLVSIIHDERRKKAARAEREQREQEALRRSEVQAGAAAASAESPENEGADGTTVDANARRGIAHEQQGLQSEATANLHDLIGRVAGVGLGEDMPGGDAVRGQGLPPLGRGGLMPPAEDSDGESDIFRRRQQQEEQLELAEEDEVQRAIQASIREHNAMTDAALDESDEDYEDEEERWVDWACGACTYMNSGGGRCAMCGTARGA